MNVFEFFGSSKIPQSMRYTCYSSLRGWCGTWHRSLDTAKACIDRDDRACKSGAGRGSYSDRRIVIAELGELRRPDEAEAESILALRSRDEMAAWR